MDRLILWRKTLGLIDYILQKNKLFDFDSKLYTVKLRVKSNDSICNKLEETQTCIQDLYDVIGIRLVLHSEDQCYQLSDSITSLKAIRVDEIRDYIAQPKDTFGYKAIHLRGRYKKQKCEIQIIDIKNDKRNGKTHDAYKKVMAERLNNR